MRLVGRKESIQSVACLYASLIACHRAPSILAELLFLSKLLGVAPSAVGGDEKEKKKNGIVELFSTSNLTSSETSAAAATKLTTFPLFSTGVDCILFAATSLDNLRHRLVHFGTKFLRRLMDHPSIHIFGHSLALFLRRILSEREDKLYDTTDFLRGGSFLKQNDDIFEALRGSSSTGGAASDKKSGGRDQFSLPSFHAASDSSNHFKSRLEKSLYSNRQEVTNIFVGMLREFADLQHSIDGTPYRKYTADMPERSRKCVALVRSNNLRWFIQRLFVPLLLQSALYLGVQVSSSSVVGGTTAERTNAMKQSGETGVESNYSSNAVSNGDRTTVSSSAVVIATSEEAAAKLRLLDRRMSKKSSSYRGGTQWQSVAISGNQLRP